MLLDKEPTNLQAQSLATLIDKRVTRGACSCSFTHPISLIHSPLPSPPCRGIHWNGNRRRSGGGQYAPPCLRHTASIPQITPFAGARLTSVRPRPLYWSICQCRCSFHSHTMVNDELSCLRLRCRPQTLSPCYNYPYSLILSCRNAVGDIMGMGIECDHNI